MSSLKCGEVDELLGAYVLTALPDLERTAVDHHLNGCPRHEAMVEELARSASLLTLAAEPQEPSREVRSKTLAAIRAEAAGATVSLGWMKHRLPVGSHVCAFHSDDEGLEQSLAFLRAGLDQPGEFMALFADRRRFGTLLGLLQEGYAGPVESLIDQGKLTLIDGAPRVEELLQGIGQRFDEAMRDGYKLIRLLGFIGWNQPGWPDFDELVAFENKVNDVARAYPAVIVCTYDVRRLPGLSLVEGGLRMHPMTVLGDNLVRNNPFFRAA